MKNRRLTLTGIVYYDNGEAKLSRPIWLINANHVTFSAATTELLAQLTEQMDRRPWPLQEICISVERTCMPTTKLRVRFLPSSSRVLNMLDMVLHLKNLADQLFPEPSKKEQNESQSRSSNNALSRSQSSRDYHDWRRS